jgi:SAM-dependent methyltransferase
MSRIYKDQQDIDAGQVKAFFNARARQEADAINAVMLQPAGSTLALDRDAYERDHLLPRPQKRLKIIEFGCGAGRLASFYAGDAESYLGIDFSEALIARANADIANGDNIRFQVAELPHIGADDLAIRPPFDLFIVTALLLYLNDAALRETFALIASLAAPQATIYVRESLSEMDVRLTLKEHFSDELGEAYNAIYRTTAELTTVMNDALVSAGFRFEVRGDYAFPPALRNRTETAQRYFTLRKG